MKIKMAVSLNSSLEGLVSPFASALGMVPAPCVAKTALPRIWLLRPSLLLVAKP